LSRSRPKPRLRIGIDAKDGRGRRVQAASDSSSGLRST
jgi:hypothetical protein